ncbi:MAG: hypothetical protein J6Y02_11790 [Pseudobutyrivibrio sp.]|nr:hypothetical protein [Lachnospiraceae bacterium]MBP5596056.1 hypothetical protein [Pseudobutyrivibrio sp.]
MGRLEERVAQMVTDHDVELVNRIQNQLMSRFENLNGSDGILVEYVRDEIADVCDDFMNELAN